MYVAYDMTVYILFLRSIISEMLQLTPILDEVVGDHVGDCEEHPKDNDS